MAYSIGRDSLHCKHCGFDRNILFDLELRVEEQDYLATLERLERLRRNQAEGTADEETIRWTSCSGTPRPPTNLRGTPCGAPAAPGGTSNAQRWCARSWA